MEKRDIDRISSLKMLRKLQAKHKTIKNNPELIKIQSALNNLSNKNQETEEPKKTLRQNPISERRIYKKIEPESYYKSIRNNHKLQKKKAQAKSAERGLGFDALFNIKDRFHNQSSLWGLKKPGFLKKGSGNYLVIPSHGVVNIPKALENRPSVVNYIKKQSPERSEGVEILYKENSNIIKYAKDQEQMVFEVQKVKANNQGKPVEAIFPTNNGKTVDIEGIDQAELNEDIEKFNNFDNVDKENVDDYKILPFDGENCEKNALEELITNKKPEDCVDHPKYNKETDGFKDQSVENPHENKDDFFGFQKVDTQITKCEFKSNKITTYNKPIEKSHINSDKILSQNEKRNPIIEDDENTYKDDPQENDPDKEIFIGDAYKKDTKASENDEEIEKTKDQNIPVYETSENMPGENFPNQDRKNAANQVQVISSQNIEIKPTHDRFSHQRRTIIKSFTIENQKPFIIPQKPLKDPNLTMEKILSFDFKARNSISLIDTPRFTIELDSNYSSYVHKPQIAPEYFELMNLLQRQFDKVNDSIEDSFFVMNNELSKWEERISWVSETCICVKRYRFLYKQIHSQKGSCKKISVASQSEYKKPIICNENLLDIENMIVSNRFEGNNGDFLAQKWLESLDMIEKKDINSAYSNLLTTNDDLYLLRLMLKTNTCLRVLHHDVAKDIMSKLSCILSSRFAENIGLNWINQSIKDNRCIKVLKSGKCETLVEGLKNICDKGGDEGKEAYRLYKYFVARFDNKYV